MDLLFQSQECFGRIQRRSKGRSDEKTLVRPIRASGKGQGHEQGVFGFGKGEVATINDEG